MLCPLCQFDNPAQARRCRACSAALSASASENGAFSADNSSADALPKGTLLASTYAVESVLGQGGFGITYRCHDQMLERPVAIKEFFPSGCRRHNSEVAPARGLSDANYREARAQFLAEARILARCHHVGIVGVYTAFEANQTAYMVMELLHGKTLAQLIMARGGRMNETEAVEIIERVGDALSFVHDLDLLHRDIKPDNIIVCDDGRVMLIDFGTAREFVKGQAQGQTVVVTPGYAPLEQYAKQATRGAFTDIYSLAATLYHLLTGAMPPAASDRALGVLLRPVRELNPQISESVARAVESALQMEIAKRPQSVREFLDLLHAPVEDSAFNISPAMQRAIERADLLQNENAEVEALFSPRRTDPPSVALFSDSLQEGQTQFGNLLPDLNEDSNNPPVNPAPIALFSDSLQKHQKLSGNLMPPPNPQPVKLAPPRDFSSATTPATAPPSPVSLRSTGGNFQVKNANSSDASLTSLWWIIAGICGIFIFAGLFGKSNSNRNSTPPYSSSSNYQSPVFNAPASANSNSLSSSEKAQKTAAALRTWDALPVIAPASIEELPTTNNSAAPPLTYPTIGGGIEFSPDGKRLAYIDGQAVLRVLRLPGRQVVRSLELNQQYPPVDIKFSPDNETIAVAEMSKQTSNGTYEGSARTEVWNLRTGKRMGVFYYNSLVNSNVINYDYDSPDYISDLAVLNNEQLLFWSGKNELLTWSPKNGKTTKTPVSISSTVSVRYNVISPDGKKLVVGDSEGVLRWFDLKTGEELAVNSMILTEGKYEQTFGHSYSGTVNSSLPVAGIDYALNGQWLASRNQGQISVFDSNFRKVDSLDIDNMGLFFSMSPDGQWLAARGSLPYSPEGTLLWNVKTKQKIRLETPYNTMRDFGFSQDGKQLYGIFADGAKLQFVTWNVDAKAATTPRLFTSLKENSLSLSDPALNKAVALSPSVQQIDISAQQIAIDLQGRIEVRQQDGGYVSTLSVSNVAATLFSPNGKSLAVRKADGAILLWEVADGDMASQLEKSDEVIQNGTVAEADEKNARSMAFSADNNLLAYVRTKGAKDSIELWDIKGEPRRLASLNQKEPLNALVFSPDNKGLICGGEKGMLQWIDVATRKTKSQIKTGEPIFDIDFAARNLVVMGESNSAVYQVPANSADPLNNADKTKLPQSFNQSRDIYTPSAISPDGKLLATAQGYNAVQIWELPSGQMLQSLPNQKTAPIFGLAFSAESNELITLGQGIGQQEFNVNTSLRAKAK